MRACDAAAEGEAAADAAGDGLAPLEHADMTRANAASSASVRDSARFVIKVVLQLLGSRG